MSSGPTYWDYLRLSELLSLQGGLEDDESKLMSDELHFIVVHQVYELWFKLILRELRLARDQLAQPRVAEETVPYVVHHLRRVSEIFKLAVQQWAVMETLTPQDFLGFRDKLIPASGFQSFQMREVESLLGLAPQNRPLYGNVDPLDHLREKAHHSPGGPQVLASLERSSSEQSLRLALHEWLYRTPIQGSSPDDAGDDEIVESFLGAYLEAHEDGQRKQAARLVANGVVEASHVERRFAESRTVAREFLLAGDASSDERARVRRIRAGLLFIESYRELPLLAWPRLLIDAVVEVEEQFILWRHRHARMTERTIGRRVGTGGSSGVDYLDRAAQERIFPELWAVRTLLLPAELLPELRNPQFYGFAV
jgi:tryptophan 2,3-dioxygenase